MAGMAGVAVPSSSRCFGRGALLREDTWDPENPSTRARTLGRAPRFLERSVGVLDSGQCPHAHFAPINGAGAGPPFHGHGHLSLLPCGEGDSGRARRRAGLARY